MVIHSTPPADYKIMVWLYFKYTVSVINIITKQYDAIFELLYHIIHYYTFNLHGSKDYLTKSCILTICSLFHPIISYEATSVGTSLIRLSISLDIYMTHCQIILPLWVISLDLITCTYYIKSILMLFAAITLPLFFGHKKYNLAFTLSLLYSWK